MSEKGTAGWPALIGRLLGDGGDPEAPRGPALGAALEAAARASRAGGVELVEWVRLRPVSLRRHGDAVELAVRPSPGPGIVTGRPVAVVGVDEHRDLVAARPPGAPAFSPAEFAGLQAVATLLRHAAALGRHDTTETLHRLSMEIVGTLDLDRVLLSIVHAAARLVASEVAGVFLTHPAADGEEELRMQCVIGHHTVETARLRIPSGRGLAGKVLATGAPARVDDYATATATAITKDYLNIAMEEGTQSGLAAPMRDAAGKIIGVLSVWRLRPSVYSDSDEDVLVSLAGLAAIGLVNARLYREQQQAAIEIEASRAELARRLLVSDEALDIHRRLTEIAAEGKDLTALAEAVQGFLGGLVVIAPDGDRECVQWPPAAPGTAVPRLRERDTRRARELLEEQAPPDPNRWVSVRIEAAGVQHGLLYARLPAAPALRDVITLEQSATICALLLGHETSLAATTARLRSEFVWDLLDGRRASATDQTARAVALGLHLGYPARVVLIAAVGFGALGQAEHWTAQQHEHNRSWIASRVATALAELVGHVVPVALREEHLVTILTGAAEPAALAAAVRGCSPFPAVDLLVGISGAAAGPDGLPDALHEARMALSAVTPATGPVVAFDDLGVLQFLLGPGGGGELHRYAEGVLGALVAYDARHGSDLVATLDAYLEHGANTAQTARSLSLHTKSLAYRLRRIGEVGGLDLNDRQTRLDIELALRILGPARELRARTGQP